ncbi:HNH endonuclease [Mesorhizobium sp. WSM4308]|uniref:HNH endonuclease n=1 Tax=Mesorhizobium sp. WSM4308 TaxID=2029409 RepID=UPI001AEFA08A|nr:HNH endonuclease [Mesorhizobium sp. WSM4308]
MNKGKTCPPGKGGRHPNARKTQFVKGHGRSGIAVDLYKPIGTERLSKDGYREIKMHDGMPLQSRWRAVHLVEWEKLNGKIPKGFALKCLDGDRLNTDPMNWECVPRALLPRLGGRFGRGYDAAPAEVKPTIMAIVKLEHSAREKSKRAA